MVKDKDRQRIRGYLNEARRSLFINHWDFTTAYIDEDVESRGDRHTAARCTALWEYEKAAIQIFPCFWEESHEDQRRIIFHEVAHCITQPTKIIWEQFFNGRTVQLEEEVRLNEWMTTKIANIALDLVDTVKPRRRKK